MDENVSLEPSLLLIDEDYKLLNDNKDLIELFTEYSLYEIIDLIKSMVLHEKK